MAAAVVAGALAGAPSAWAGKVVFSSDRCPESRQATCIPSIWTINDDGSDLRRITLGFDSMPEPSSYDEEPSWSPLGDSILYTRTIGERRGLWIMRFDGSGKRQIAPDASVGDYLQPDWSPSGLWVTFAGSNSIWLMRADGSGLRRLTQGAFDSAPTFSPDGRRVVFARGSTASDWQLGLYAVGLDGRGLAPVVVGHVEEQDALFPIAYPSPNAVSYSPDGRSLAFSILRAFYTVRLDTGEVRRLAAPDMTGDLAWAAAPGPALIVADAPGGTGPLRRLDLDRPVSAPRQFTPPQPEPYDYVSGERAPDWTPVPAVPSLPDELPPTGALLGGRTVRVGSSRRRMAIRASRSVLKPFVADPSGVRRFEVAVARRRGRRCRFLGRRRFGKPRACSRPTYRRLTSLKGWTNVLRRLPANRTYQFRLRARDGAGNRRKRPRATTVRLKP